MSADFGSDYRGEGLQGTVDDLRSRIEELLAVLKDALRVIDGCAYDAEGTPSEVFFHQKAQYYSRVIAKAEGR